MAPTMPSNRSEYRDVFAENLRQLVAGEPSISACCRALDINRTQFNRYLSGETYPRPDVLARICDHFGCNARILLEPLDEIRDETASLAPLAGKPDPFRPIMQDFDHARMPDGVYRMILPSLIDPDILYIDLIRLYTVENRIKAMHWSVPKSFAKSTGKSTLWRDRKTTGFVYQHVDGVSFLMASPYSRMIMMTFISPGYRGVPTMHTGYCAMTQMRGEMQSQVQPIILEKLPDGFRAAMAARREQTDFGRDRLSDSQRKYLDGWTPN